MPVVIWGNSLADLHKSYFSSFYEWCPFWCTGGFHSKSEPLHVDPFDWRQPSDHAWYSYRTTLSHNTKLGNGFNHRCGLDFGHALDYVDDEREEEIMKKFANIYLTVAFLLLYLPIFYLIFMPLMKAEI